MVMADLNECLHVILGECSLHIEVIVRVENCSLHLHQCGEGECACECVCVCVGEGGGGRWAWRSVCMDFNTSRYAMKYGCNLTVDPLEIKWSIFRTERSNIIKILVANGSNTHMQLTIPWDVHYYDLLSTASTHLLLTNVAIKWVLV